MLKKQKKGFTIVELVVVIAVIAILAAVLIPTFAGLIKKANQSVDIQATRQMNTLLASSEGGGTPVNSIDDVIKTLNEENIDLDNYKPLTSGRTFYWYKTENRILYVDENNSVLYPEEYKNVDVANEKGTLYSLNGEIKMESYTVTEEAGEKQVSVSNGGQLVSLINDYNKNNGDAKAVKKITLASDIDLKGATYKFVGDKNGKIGFSSNLVLDGNNHTIYGFRDDQNSIFGSGEYAQKGYGYGMFYSIGENANVTIQNIKFSGMVVKDSENESTGTLGLIAGYVYGNLKLENVTIENSLVSGFQKVGAIAGRVDGSLELDNVTLKNVQVKGDVEAAKLVGYVTGNTTVNNVVATENVTVSNNSGTFDEIYGSWGREISKSDMATATGIAQNGKLYVSSKTKNSAGNYYIWSCITEDYFWKVIGEEQSIFQIGEDNYYWYGLSTSENITKA